MKKINCVIFLSCLALIFAGNSCQKEFEFDDPGTGNVILKKGGRPAGVEQGDLYGDLWELERDLRGVPIIYAMPYLVYYQDVPVMGHIDLMNPRLNLPEPISAEVISRDENGYVIMTEPTDGSDPVPVMVEATIDPGDDGFLGGEGELNPWVLYDGEGEILEWVANYVFPVEEGRLNLVRASDEVLVSRMTEVIKNFGDGTVAAVTRDYCGRLYMVRTQAAQNAGIADKPIDSPLENMAIYKELLLHGFQKSAPENGLAFLNENFNFKSRIDIDWGRSPVTFGNLVDSMEENQFISNLAAACVSAASDKGGILKLDEIVFLNMFLHIPETGRTDLSQPATQVICSLPTVELEVHGMNKTDKSQTVKYLYFVNYEDFSYSREKFNETMIDQYTIDENFNKILVKENLQLYDILIGNYSGVLDPYKFTILPSDVNAETHWTNALGFAHQADDYVQALEVIHNNEEYLTWAMPTPTWPREISGFPAFDRETSPFSFVPEEVSHSKKPISRSGSRGYGR